MCEEYSFPWKRKIVHSPGPQAEFDDCLIAANFAGNMPVHCADWKNIHVINTREETIYIEGGTQN